MGIAIAARIPKTTAEGFGYRVRVISSEPGVIGSDNGDNITIYPVANTNIIGDTIVCNNVVKTYSTVYEDNIICLWRVKNGELLTDSTGFNIQIQWDRFYQNGTLTLIKTNVATECSDTTNWKIYIKSPPAVEIAWGDYNVCQGETVGYSAASSTLSIYHWEVQGGVIIGASNLKDVDVIYDSDIEADFARAFEKSEDYNKADPRPISMKDFLEILKKRKPSIPSGSLIQYEKWFNEFKAL